MTTPIRIVATDTNILINLFHVDAFDLLARLPPWEFVVTDEVLGEVLEPAQRARVDEALDRGTVRRHSLSLLELKHYADLSLVMQTGEASSLAIAHSRGWIVASDEGRVFRRKAEELLGKGRLLTTPGILVAAIRAKLLTVAEADAMKVMLEKNRFKMKFASFADVV